MDEEASTFNHAVRKLHSIVERYPDLTCISQQDLVQIALILVGDTMPIQTLMHALDCRQMHRTGCASEAQRILTSAEAALRHQQCVRFMLEYQSGRQWTRPIAGMFQCRGSELDGKLAEMARPYHQNPARIWHGQAPGYRWVIQL